MHKICALKKLAIICLFLAFIARPVYFTGYVMYFQANLDYVIENYCINKEQPVLKCNGKCHLKKQLSVFSQTDQEKETAVLSQIAEAFYPIYFQESGLQYSLLPKTHQQNVFASTQNLYKYSYLNKLLKPPMVSFYNTQLS